MYKFIPKSILGIIGLWLLLIPLSGCHKSDQERAALERAELHARLNKSLALVPYRGAKIVLRASKMQPPPPALVELIKLNASTLAILERPASEFTTEAKQIGVLVVNLLRASAVLSKEDEDRYPLLWNLGTGLPLPPTWYDAGVEHLAVAVAELFVDAATKRDPVVDFMFYELERATPQPQWPAPLRVLTTASRGWMFFLSDKHYAADEEYASYLQAVTALSNTELAWLSTTQTANIAMSAESMRKALLALGYLSRSANRFALDRDAAAYDDLEAGLKTLQSLGVENELTDWGWMTLHIHRGHYEQAAKSVERLAQSPNLTDEDRTAVRACAGSLRKLDKGFVLFGRKRAQLVLLRALAARAGGVEKILATLLGPENAAKLYRPLAYLEMIRHEVTASGELGQKATDKTKELGQKGYDLIKQRIQKESTSQ